VRATSVDDVTLTLSTGKTVVWGSEERSSEKGLVLNTMMTANPGASTYDVSTPDVAVAG
jgi:cell division protein FtsQ